MSCASIAWVCVSERKGVPKAAVERAELRAGHGIVGDAHAGPWHRQVSLLAEADIEAMRVHGLDLAPGAFGEDVVKDLTGYLILLQIALEDRAGNETREA